jgi:transposase
MGLLRALAEPDERRRAAARVLAARTLQCGALDGAGAGCPWRMIPNDLPPWSRVQQQAQRWSAGGCFEAMGHDLREVLRLVAEKAAAPAVVILDGRTLQSTPESGRRAGYDGYKRKRGSKVHLAVDTLWAISWR